MEYKKTIRKGASPYDLSAHEWRCKRCNGLKPPSSPYEGMNSMERYCMCNTSKPK